MIKPRVIYLKNKRDMQITVGEKGAEKLPQDEYGYFGGFSPSRKDVYQNQGLTAKYKAKRFNKGDRVR